jgi:hypothetical protein
MPDYSTNPRPPRATVAQWNAIAADTWALVPPNAHDRFLGWMLKNQDSVRDIYEAGPEWRHALVSFFLVSQA